MIDLKNYKPRGWRRACSPNVVACLEVDGRYPSTVLTWTRREEVIARRCLACLSQHETKKLNVSFEPLAGLVSLRQWTRSAARNAALCALGSGHFAENSPLTRCLRARMALIRVSRKHILVATWDIGLLPSCLI